MKATRIIPNRATLATGVALGFLLLTLHAPAAPVGGVTFKDDAPFQGAYSSTPVTSNDGLLTVGAWLDADATISGSLWQWWWIIGVDDPAVANPPENGALLDQQEALTLQFDRGVGASHIAFLHSGGIGGTANNLARINISGFLSDPGAYAATYNKQRIFNIAYANGTVSLDYLWDEGNDYGLLLFSKPAASAAQNLKITGSVSPNGDATGYGLGLFRVDCSQLYGGPSVEPVVLKQDVINAYTTPDGGLTIKGYSDRDATIPGNFGLYADQCFGVYGGANKGAVDTDETLTMQFAPGYGLSRLDCVYSSGLVTISGFASDPGFIDLGQESYETYADGVLSFYPAGTGQTVYFFTNRAASAGRTLRVNVDPNPPYQFAIGGIGYVDLDTLITRDIPDMAASHTTVDGLLTLNAYADTPGTTPATLYENVDWFGVDGGLNREAVDGAESLSLQFSGGAGLAGIGTRYTSGGIVISGFGSDPGFTDPSGTATGVSYANGTLTYTFDQYRAPEVVVRFSNLSASAGRTLSMHTDGAAGSQIALTRIDYGLPATTVTLTVAKVGGDVVLTWPSGTLQQASLVSGTYNDVIGATSPYTNAVSGTQSYFRVKVR